MQEGRIEIKTRPQKSGWLEQQVNSVFNIWQSKYFVLDGTELLVFDDDQRLQPIASVNLHRCIVDGIWQQEEMYIITIRSLNQDMEEQFVQFNGSCKNMTDLIFKIAQLTIIKIIDSMILLIKQGICLHARDIRVERNIKKRNKYETLFKQLEAEEQIDKHAQTSDETISDMDSDDFQEHPGSMLHLDNQLADVYTSQNIPNELQMIQQDIESKFQENKNTWTLYQVESQLRIYKQVNHKANQVYYKMKGYLEHIDFDSICSIFSDPLNDQFWDFYLQEKELYLKVKEDYQVYKTKESFYKNKQTYNFQNVYREISWFDVKLKNKVFYQLKQNIQDNSKEIKNENIIPLKIQKQIIKLEYVKKGFIQLQIFLSVPLKYIQTNHIIEPYLMERFINFSVFKFEYKEIVEKVQQRQRRLIGEIGSDVKEHMYQPIKSFTGFDDHENTLSLNKSITSFRKTQNNNDPSWNEDLHLRVKKLDQEQLEIFNRFKQKNLSVNLTDNEYIQFLHARKFNEESSQEMLDNCIKWKLENNFHNLSLDNFSHLHRLKAYRYVGKDPQGRPIGLGVSRYIFPSQLPCDLDEYCLYYCVYLNHLRNLADGYVDQIIMINDVGGLTSDNVDLSLTRRQLKLVLDLFPEGVFKLIAINVDIYCRVIWRAIKPFLEKNTQDKIVIVGGDQKEIHETLLQYMDDELIPVIYGGKNQMYSSY